MTCSGCSFEAPPDFAFCPKCGAKLAPRRRRRLRPSPPSAPEGDRRPVTVLFADLAGFTSLSEGLDPEDVRAIQTDLFREMSASIERYEGFVEKFVGDAVMAVFGAPRAHEDDPERALRAALLMHERVGALDRALGAAGRAAARAARRGQHRPGGGGQDRRDRSAYAVTGDTVNTASRLQSAAPSGEILRRRDLPADRARLRLRPGGRDRDEGQERAGGSHRLLGARAAPRSARGLHASGCRAPGRPERELARMVAAFEEMPAAGPKW